jgi:nitrogen regulatory protein P-II 1
MKEIRAYIQPHKLSALAVALMEIPGFPGMSVMDCEGVGRRKTLHTQDYHPFLNKKRLEIIVPDQMADIVFDTIMQVAHSGQSGDGKVFILDVAQGGRISSGERSSDLT